MSFNSIDLLPLDPIMKLPGLFAAEKNPQKVNLGIGSYHDENGVSKVLQTVSKAEQILLDQKRNKDYLPIDGSPVFLEKLLQLVFGAEKSSPIVASQTVGGTSALRLAGEFLSRNICRQIYIPDPTWANHWLIYRYANLAAHPYPYYSHKTHRFDLNGMLNAISKMAPGSVILLHASCHNPTGCDPTEDEWRLLSKAILSQQLIPLFDLAYQGFGKGIDQDVFSVRQFVKDGHKMFVAVSLSKNFGLYGERVGLLAAVTDDTEKMKSHLKQIARSDFSNPPVHGSRIVETILSSPELTLEWKKELEQMRQRIEKMRQKLVSGLTQIDYIQDQLGMFSYTGLNLQQVEKLRTQFGVYLADDGRANIAGLNEKNCDYVIQAIRTVLNE